MKEFARQMVAEHTMAGEERRSQRNQVTKPPRCRRNMPPLETLKGASEQKFQPLYIDMQTIAHMEAVTLFATYAKSGDDPAVKEFATKTLPKLEMHKMHAMKLVAVH